MHLKIKNNGVLFVWSGQVKEHKFSPSFSAPTISFARKIAVLKD